MVNDNQSSSAGGWGENKNFNDRNTSTDDWGANKERKFGDRNREYRDNDRDFKKKHFRKEGSEISSSGSEKSFGKGARTSSRNDSRPPRHDKRFDNKKLDNSWNVSAVPVIMDSAPNDAKFKEIDVNGRQERITISWFHNPSSFFCQLVESQESFKKLMQEVQEAYKHRKPGLSVQGAPAIALFPEDNVLYRARIIEVTDNQYKVYYVDFGNVSVVDKVWPIDNKFMEMPMQAIPSGLSGIEPINGNWPNPDNFSKYFEKEYLDCDFLMVDNGKYWINLSSENENVCQQLVNDGLAKYSELSTMEFEISLLVGQQFHAMIQIINSLSDLKILLQSGITVNCSIHNLSSATETYEEILKENLEKILIVYADNLVDDRLEITLYDLSGNKLNIIIPDEGAFDTVDPFCPYLVTKSTIEGFVSHINENSIVIQPTECSKNIEYFVEQMYEYYENLPPDNPLIPEEEFVYATKSSDGNWYRGKVTTFDDDKATVIYLDYGNSEEVSFSCLRELISQFIEWDIMAVTVSVKVPTADFLNQEVTALVYYSDAGLEGEIKVIAEHEHVIPEITPETKNVTNVSSQQFSETTSEPLQEASEISIPQSVETTGIGTGNGESTSSDIETGNSTSDGTSVILSHIDSPSDFYIQLVNSQDSINELQLKLQEDIKIMAQLDSASVGGLCAAPYSIDQQWYRSQILDADDDITTVRFIDYGNTDVIDNKSTKIKTLPPELLSLEEYATRCRLKIKPIEEEWSKGANERFEELTSVENIKVEFIDQDEKTNYVELYSNGDNVKDILIQENLAVLDNVVLEGKLTGFISHINSPSEFWVQLESCCVELEWIAEQLSNAGSFPDLEDLTPGCLCAAMFPDDEMWYRARILSNTVAGLEVLFLDYGNSCICSNLKQLPEHLVLAPPLAQKCSLQKPEGLLSWSAEASQKFNELSAEGQTVFTVKKLTTGETSLVELLVDGEDVSSKLLPTTDNGFVNNIESLERFSISKEGVVSEEKYKLEKISGTDYNEECIEKFVEINNEGKTQYEVEYLPEYTVRLYLNGRDIRNSLKEVLHKEKISQSLSLTTTTQAENESALSAVTDQTTNQFKKTTDLDSCNNDIALQKLENENTSESTVEMVDSIVANIINEALSANTINLELKQEANEGNSVLYREENEEKTDVEENSPIKEIECDTLVTMNEDQPTNFGDNTSGEFDTNVSNESLDTSNISLVNNIPDKSEDNVEENIFEPAINLTKGEVITSVVENVICENEFDSSKTTGLEDSSSRNTANLQEISASQISQGLELAQAYIEQKAVEEQSANSPEAKVVTLQVETHGNIPTNEGKSTDENAEYSVNEIDVHQESVEPETKGHSEPEPCIKKSEESKIDKNSFKIEFHENILASFPAPSTIENVKVVTKLSPTKVVPKSQDSIE
ncbi:hypothetical protein HHI36_005130 [Cryptolaemus montrouzieri]|uniref:Tudor domain-containing protein n=1 Tax=Cryptolaemus montrouzieri TaxID=559131 RepID=A0ABD2NTR1_9CUCU